MTLASSCKEEYIDSPYAYIERFSVADTAGNALHASIVDGDIIVYWPYGQIWPETVIPEIILSDGASVLPTSGTEVAFDSTTVYTVTAQNGSSASYTLRPANTQPIPSITSLTAAGQYGTVDGKFTIYGTAYQIYVNGTNFIPSTASTQAYLIWGDEETEIPWDVASVTSTRINLEPLDDLDMDFSVGDTFGLKIVTDRRTAVYDGQILLGAAPPQFDALSEAVAVQRGATVILSGSNLADVTRVLLGTNAVLSRAREVEIISATDTTVTIRIPDDFATGNYLYSYAYYDASIYYAAGYTRTSNINGALTVTE